MARVAKLGWQSLLLPLLLVLVCLGATTSARAFDLEISISSGHDDNPRLEKGSEEAFFTQTGLNLWWTLPLNDIPATSISTFAFADYQAYSGLDNNWQLGGGLVSATQVQQIPGTFNLFCEATSYRNPLVSDNDYDNLNLGTSFIWFARPQLSLKLETSLSWEAYCDTVTDVKQKPNKNENHHFRAKESKSPKHHNVGDRSDRLFTTSLKSLYAFTPTLDGSGEISWSHRHSSIDAERRSAYGLNLNFIWQPIPPIEFNWQMGGERIPYKFDYQGHGRTEKIYNLAMEVSWYMQNLTILAAWDWSERNSTINEDDYQRNQWQIRLKYSY